eukprot:7380880-Prymnesium_polylepis.1
MASSAATSATVHAITPAVSRAMLHGMTPASGYRPSDGRMPTTPAYSAGPRIEPSVSEPMPMGA